jgi:hypothetical protein
VRVVAVLTALAMASSALSPRRSRTANNDEPSLTGRYGAAHARCQGLRSAS